MALLIEFSAAEVEAVKAARPASSRPRRAAAEGVAQVTALLVRNTWWEGLEMPLINV